MRAIIHLLIVRNILPFYELKTIEKIDAEDHFISIFTQTIAIILLLLCVCICERLTIAGPMNILYCLFLVFGCALQMSYVKELNINNTLYERLSYTFQ